MTGRVAAVLLLAAAAPCSAQRRGRRSTDGPPGGPAFVAPPMPSPFLIPPQIAPEDQPYRKLYYGEREIVPAGETNNTFIGGWGMNESEAAAKPGAEPAAKTRAEPAGAAWPARVMPEDKLPDSDAAAASESFMSGEQTWTASTPRPSARQLPAGSREPPEPALSERAAPAAAVKPPMAGRPESMPDLPAAPAREAKPAEAKAVVLEDVPLSHDAIPDLIALLKTGSPKLRARAADELGRRGPSAAAAVPALTDALGDSGARLRASAALALGNIGGDADRLSRLLRPLRRDKSADVRVSAETALDRLKGP